MANVGDLLLYNGRVKTMDRLHPTATAVAIAGGRIVAVGTDDEARAAAANQAEVIDLQGRTATPGLNDAHAHPKLLGAALLDVDLASAPHTPITDITNRIARVVPDRPAGQWIIGRGYDQARLAENRHPTRHDLDPLTDQHPILLYRSCYHVGVANSAALRAAGIDRNTPDPAGGRIDRDEHGEPTGVVRETALALVADVRGLPTISELEASLIRSGQELLSVGITSVGEAGLYRPEELTAYQRLHREGRLHVRTNLMMLIDEMLEPLTALGVSTGFGDDWLRIGPAKLFADGTIGGQTAKLRESFVGQPENTGLFMIPPDEIKAKVLAAHLAGFQVAIHAIGDAAIDLVLDAYEAALAAHPRADHRHRIEHCSIVDEATIRRIAAMGAIPIPGTSFLHHFREGYIQNLGYDRIRYAYGLATYNEHGVVAAASSDAPVVPADPRIGLQTMMTRRDASNEPIWLEEAIDLDAALRAYTAAGAYATFEDDIKGTLAPGKLGDVTVFGTDLDTVPAEEIGSVPIDYTVVNGQVAFARDGAA